MGRARDEACARRGMDQPLFTISFGMGVFYNVVFFFFPKGIFETEVRSRLKCSLNGFS